MTANELRTKFLEFFESKGHKVIPSSSLVPENDPSVLFTTAGMHPLVPYLLGESHPQGKRLADVQLCLRTDDIDEVGDRCHHTFFEMLGNWSLGDYWKEDAIKWSYEFLTSKLNLEKSKLAVSCFEGDADAPKDDESADVWRSLGIDENRIAFLPKKDNWWGPAGETGPCGPDTEMFYWTGAGDAPDDFQKTHEDPNWVEIWNDVFMQYNKTANGKFEPLAQKNVDTGMGLERTLAVLNGFDDNYQTELFQPIIKKIEELSNLEYGEKTDEEYIKDDKQCWVDARRAFRIIADHLRAAVFVSSENLEPSNTGQGYVLRRLIRRAVRYGWTLKIKSLRPIIETVIKAGEKLGYELKKEKIIETIINEEEKFKKTIDEGLKKSEAVFKTKKIIPEDIYAKIMQHEEKGEILAQIYSGINTEPFYGATPDEIKSAYITGEEAFNLYQTYGFPVEMIMEMAQEKRLFVDIRGFRENMALHQDLSRTASAGMFKGGLADNKVETTRLHTAAHLLLAALRIVLGNHVTQKGSNITEERLRFDFSHPEKLTDEQIAEVEKIVNEKIAENLPVTMEEMTVDEAKNSGAMGVFDDRYGDKVKVYTIGPDQQARDGERSRTTRSGPPFSREICGGPHVSSTGDLGHFKITKEESSSAGIRRIKAILENKE